MRKTANLKSIARAMLACGMSVVLVLGLTPTPALADPPDDTSPALAAAELDLGAASSSSIEKWSALQEEIDSAENGATIKLTQGLTASADDNWLDIPSSKKLTIDLNGYTLNRGLGEDGATAKDKGAVIQVGRYAELTLINSSTSEASIRGGNNSSDGGGIVNKGVLVVGGQDDPAAIRITGNKTDLSGGCIYNAGTTEINGAIMNNNEADGSGGALYNEGGALTVTNGSVYSNSTNTSGGGIFSSGGTVTLDGTVIENCFAKEKGGAISGSGTLTVEYGEILGNHAEQGGGIFVMGGGNATIEDGTMSRNSATENGGGAYVDVSGTLTLGYSPSIHTNTAGASGNGGGIYVRGSLVVTGGRPTVSNNRRGNSAADADNIYLPGTKKIEVAGHLSGGKLAVTLAGGTGQVTQGFGAQGNATATSFKGDNLHAAVKNGEIWLQAEEQQQVFMDPNQYPLRHYPKPSEVGATNWMAAIPDDWLISEFNIPYSHDSATKNISPYNVIGNTGVQLIKGRGWSFAVTQVHTIPEQLNMGVRCLDVRLNNEYPHNGTTVSVEKADDGHSLWICHGKSKSGGTYYAYDDDGNRISFEKVLDYAKSFLTDHPTETITILLTAETQWPKENSETIWGRARNHLQALSTTINPSTGKSFLYCEEGQGFFNTYNHFPRLGDCRGQIVIQYDSSYEYSEEAYLFVGGMQGLRDVDSQWPNGVTWKREKGGNGVSASDKIDNINEFIRSVEWYPIARDVTTRRDHFYFMSPSTHVESIMSYITLSDQPYKIAEKVNEEFFDMYGAFFNQRGTYVGWVKLDGIKERYARLIWQSNFPEDDNFLDYCNITVKSGQDPQQFPDQFYGPIVKGCTITLPECIYDYDPAVHGEFLGWEVQKSGYSEKELMHPGDTYIVDIDTTITAKWGKIGYDRLQVNLELGARDASLDSGQSTSFTWPAGEKLDMTKMNQASRPYYELDGWYTADGVKITDTTRLRQSLCDKDGNGAVIMTEPDSSGFTHQRITLTAHWTSTKTPASIVTAPTARNLSYTGRPQELVSAGIAAGGTLVYALGDDGESAPSDGDFGTAIPTGTESGTYYVWYKAVGDAGHYDTEAASVAVTIREHVHVAGDAQRENQVAATCTEEGSYDKVVRCAECGELLSSTHVSVAALGHNWGEWIVQEEATEEHDGLRYRVCGRCSETEFEAIPALEHVHRYELVEEVEPSCVKSGVAAHYECACGQWFSYSEVDEAKIETSPAACVIPATGHTALDLITPERTGEVPATCTEPGSHRDVYRCDKCGQVLKVVHVVDAAQGHAWIVDETTNAEGWRASTTGSTVHEQRECAVCGFTEERTYDIGHDHDYGFADGVPATCDQPGVKEHYACLTCGHVFLYDTATARLVEATEADLVIPALGHDWSTPAYAQSPDGATVTASRVCGRDANHVESETAAFSPTVTKEATCTEAGELTYTAAFANEAFEPQVRTEAIAALGHVPRAPVHENVVPATATNWGSYDVVFYCAVCGEELKRIAEVEAPIGHCEHSAGDWERQPITPATCTHSGYSYNVLHCAKCDEVLTSRLVREDALGHDWGEPAYTWSADGAEATAARVCSRDVSHLETESAQAEVELIAAPTCTEPGSATYTATFVNEAFEPQTRTESIPALGHDWGEWTVVEEPTCEEPGIEARTCANDPTHMETREIAALGHDWSAWVVTKEPTETAEGEETRTCSRCGEVETRPIPKKGVVSYRAVSGDGATWTKGSNVSLTFTFERTFDDDETFGHFTGIQVDGTEVSKSDYAAVPGSVVVTLPPGYLETLSVGGHTLTARFDDAVAAPAAFKVVARSDGATKPASPKTPATAAKTGDSLQAPLTVAFAVFVVSALALAVLVIRRRGPKS